MSCNNQTAMSGTVNTNCVMPNATTLSASSYGGLGVTYWGYNTVISASIPPGGSHTFSFTGTEPKCYADAPNNCNVTFNAYALQDDTTEDQVTLTTYLSNSKDIWSSSANLYISPKGTHNIWHGTDVVQPSTPHGYNDTAVNYFTIQNNSAVPVQIDNFQIQRQYGLCNLGQEDSCDCNSGSIGCSNCSSSDYSIATGGNIDTSREDYPCNFEECGKRGFSYSSCNVYATQPIGTGDCRSWTFDWSGTYSGYNYEKGDVCLFNFNQVYPSTDASTLNDLKLDILLNGSTIENYYISPRYNSGSGPAPTVNLMKYTGIYNDTGPNTVTLVNDSSNDVPIYMADTGGVNIYRSYQTGDLITYIQSARATGYYTSTYTGTLSTQPAEGNILIAVIGNCSPSGVATNSISQYGVNWTAAYMAASDNGVAVAEIWYGTVGSNASQTLTLYASGSAYYHVCDVREYHGLASSPLDQVASNSGYSNTVDSGTTPLTSQANELWVGALVGTSGSCGISQPPTNSFSMYDGSLYYSIEVGFCEKFVTSTGNANVSASLCDSPAWAGCIATFKGSN